MFSFFIPTATIIIYIASLIIFFETYRIRNIRTRSQIFRKKIKYLPKNPKRNVGSLNSENEYFSKIER